MRIDTSGNDEAPDHVWSSVPCILVPHESPVLVLHAAADGLRIETTPESGTPAETPPMEKALTPPEAVSEPIPAEGGVNDVHAAFTQGVNMFPDSHATDAQFLAKLLAGVEPAIGQNFENLSPQLHGRSLPHRRPDPGRLIEGQRPGVPI